MAKAKELPKEVYMTQETDDDMVWLNADADLNNLADKGKKIRVGLYKLVDVFEVSLELDIIKVG